MFAVHIVERKFLRMNLRDHLLCSLLFPYSRNPINYERDKKNHRRRDNPKPPSPINRFAYTHSSTRILRIHSLVHSPIVSSHTFPAPRYPHPQYIYQSTVSLSFTTVKNRDMPPPRTHYTHAKCTLLYFGIFYIAKITRNTLLNNIPISHHGVL